MSSTRELGRGRLPGGLRDAHREPEGADALSMRGEPMGEDAQPLGRPCSARPLDRGAQVRTAREASIPWKSGSEASDSTRARDSAGFTFPSAAVTRTITSA